MVRDQKKFGNRWFRETQAEKAPISIMGHWERLSEGSSCRHRNGPCGFFSLVLSADARKEINACIVARATIHCACSRKHSRDIGEGTTEAGLLTTLDTKPLPSDCSGDVEFGKFWIGSMKPWKSVPSTRVGLAPKQSSKPPKLKKAPILKTFGGGSGENVKKV